jgi:hypothetical protein
MMTKFQLPTDDQVKEALRRIPTTQLKRAFFEGLKNPLWVGPLAKQGAFNDPPEPEVTEDGLIRDIYWPEIDYLVRAAPDAPEDVVDVLLKFGQSNNAWVRRGVFAIGSTIPADQAARLRPLITSWQSSGFGWRTDPRDLVGFSVNLLQGRQYDAGQLFLRLLFKPSGVKGRRKRGSGLEDYWYEEGLPKVVAVLGDDGLAHILPLLVDYERSSGHLTKESDLTYFWRDSIRSRAGSRNDVEHVLIDAVRDLAIKAMLVDASRAKDALLETRMLLGRKIALFSLGEAIQQVSVEDKRLEALLAVASELLFGEESKHHSCRIDYAELARAVAQVSTESLEPLTQFIEAVPQVDDDRLPAWMDQHREDGTEVDRRAQDDSRRWQHRLLSAIGVEALPAQLQARLAELDSRYGVIDSPLEPVSPITSWTRPNSPLSQDEMAAMSPGELVAQLESWNDSGDGWGPEPSHRGQGRELSALVAMNPTAVVGIDNLVARLRPTYLRAILQGWEAALKADLELDWTQVVELVEDVLGHSNESPFPPEGDRWDDDTDFRGAKHAAVGLLEELAKNHTVPDETMSRFAELLVTSAADDTAWTEYIAYAKDSGMDPLTTSLNWQWPIRVRGLIYLMSRGKDTEWYRPARSAFEDELSRTDPHGASRAVLGESLGRLLSMDPEWLKSNISELFGSDGGLSVEQQVALTTAMAVHHYNPTLFQLLASSMIGAIRSKQPIASGWRTESDPLQRIGEWVIHAVIYGDKTIDDAVADEFFSTAPAKVRGDALGHIAWAFMHAETVDDAIRDRFAALWDTRVAHVRAHPTEREELNGFYWFVKSHKFAVEWWLPRLKDAAELDPHIAAECYMIAKEVASSADIDPRTALDVLKLLLEQDEAGMTAYALTSEAAPSVIARAIASGDEALKQDAVAYMNHLGEKGNLSLEVEVNDILDDGVTRHDVKE